MLAGSTNYPGWVKYPGIDETMDDFPRPGPQAVDSGGAERLATSRTAADPYLVQVSVPQHGLAIFVAKGTAIPSDVRAHQHRRAASAIRGEFTPERKTSGRACSQIVRQRARRRT